MTREDRLLTIFRNDTREAILNTIFAPTKKQYDEQLERLIIKHVIASGSRAYGFLACNKVVPSTLNYREAKHLKPLHENNVDEYLALIELKNTHRVNKTTIKNYLNVALIECCTTNDAMTLMPECLHDTLHTLYSLYAPSSMAVATRHDNVTQELADSINTKYQSTITLIKKQLFINMLDNDQ